MTEIAYGKTALGRLVYDLGFTSLSDSYLARKHKMPIAEIRKCRAAYERGTTAAKRSARKRRRRS
jgi:hypothetical protein